MINAKALLISTSVNLVLAALAGLIGGSFACAAWATGSLIGVLLVAYGELGAGRHG